VNDNAAYDTIACMSGIEINELVRSRRKTIALIVQPDGRLLVRAPLRTNRKIIDAFVASKADWIEKTRQIQQKKHRNVIKQSFSEGGLFWYLGQQYALKVVSAQRPSLQFQLGFSIDQKSLPQAKNLFEKWYRDQARLYLTERVNYFAQANNFQYKKIRIGSARTRWGSCSSNGTLSFPWRLIMTPPEIVDYVVLHELAHTFQHNHSQKFWSMVEGMLPDYKNKRKWLKQNSYLFHWE
jgi:predicted metal-dependent hydrolase